MKDFSWVGAKAKVFTAWAWLCSWLQRKDFRVSLVAFYRFLSVYLLIVETGLKVEIRARSGIDTRVEPQKRDQKSRVRELLLLVKVSKILASILLIKLTGWVFQQELQCERELGAISKARLALTCD